LGSDKDSSGGFAGEIIINNSKSHRSMVAFGRDGFLAAEGARIGTIFFGSRGRSKAFGNRSRTKTSYINITNGKSKRDQSLIYLGKGRAQHGNKELRPIIRIGSERGDPGQMEIVDDSGEVSISLLGQNDGEIYAGYVCAGRCDLNNIKSRTIEVLNSKGEKTLFIDGIKGDIVLFGADCAEEFDVVEEENIDPGTVMVIGDDSRLRPSERPYDRRVAGIVSGGNNYFPGIILDGKPSDTKRLPVALTGKTYCRVDASNDPIEIGDLLTTSSTRGCAMKAKDRQKAFGAVIGKALASVCEGIGMIPILVALQ